MGHSWGRLRFAVCPTAPSLRAPTPSAPPGFVHCSLAPSLSEHKSISVENRWRDGLTLRSPVAVPSHGGVGIMAGCGCRSWSAPPYCAVVDRSQQTEGLSIEGLCSLRSFSCHCAKAGVLQSAWPSSLHHWGLLPALSDMMTRLTCHV